MRAVAAGLSDVGRTREHNEDRFILLPEFNVYVVADGMGGHQSGEVASRMAASAIASYFRGEGERANAMNPGQRLREALVEANKKIHSRADDSRMHRGMGTTAVAGVYSPDDRMFFVAHAGDSRCYVVRGSNIKQLTRDHSLIAEALLERPDLSETDLGYLPKNVITRALGISPTVEVDLCSERAFPSDVFLLCSDGLHGLINDELIAEIVQKHAILTDACCELVQRANEAGGRDNITVVLVRIEPDEAPWSRPAPPLRDSSSGASQEQVTIVTESLPSTPAGDEG